MRVIHVAPTRFGADGLFGGGERYPLELARAMARDVECELVSFGPRSMHGREAGGLRVRTLRPLAFLSGHPAYPIAPRLLTALSEADLIHTHHMRSTPSGISALAALVRRQRIVVTDHGLTGGNWAGLLPR